eukprot:13372106-Alexandrium_andersonii.AAC.1
MSVPVALGTCPAGNRGLWKGTVRAFIVAATSARDTRSALSGRFTRIRLCLLYTSDAADDM